MGADTFNIAMAAKMFIATVFVNNIVLAKYLGQCPFFGCSKGRSVAIGMGAAVVFVTIIATAITWGVQVQVLAPLRITYLQTIVFILVIASLVQFVEMFLKKMVPPLYKSLGIFLPLITTNCAVLGVALMVHRDNLGFMEAMFFAFAASAGFLLALFLMSGLRERLETVRTPRCLVGTPVAMILAGIMSLAFMAFRNMA